MGETDNTPGAEELVSPKPRNPPEAGPPIFSGSVSLWMGAKTIVSASILELVGLAGIIYWVFNQQGGLGPAPLIVGVALFISSNLMLAYTIVNIRCYRYLITRRLIEREQGIFVKRVDSLDLARVKDVELSQSLMQRMLNIGTIEIFSSDKTDPVMLVEAIPNPRPVYEKLRDAVIELSQRRGVIPMS